MMLALSLTRHTSLSPGVLHTLWSTWIGIISGSSCHQLPDARCSSRLRPCDEWPRWLLHLVPNHKAEHFRYNAVCSIQQQYDQQRWKSKKRGPCLQDA
ncbi:unnamed protein product, partial [Ostreobium quekettii]